MRDWTPITCTVLQVYNLGGKPVADVERLGTPPRKFIGLPVLVQGGGARSAFVPPSVGAEVLVGFSADAWGFPSPYVMGAWADREMLLASGQQADEPEGDTADATLDAEALALQNGGAQMVIDRHGAIRETPAPGQPYRVELTDGAQVFVSRDGESGDRATLAGALVPLLQQWQAAIIALQTQVAAATLTLEAVVASSPIVPPLPPYVAPTPPTTPTIDLIGSAVLRLSSETPANEGDVPEN